MTVTPLVVDLEADQSDVLAVADALPQGRERRPGVVGPQVLPGSERRSPPPRRRRRGTDFAFGFLQITSSTTIIADVELISSSTETAHLRKMDLVCAYVLFLEYEKYLRWTPPPNH